MKHGQPVSDGLAQRGRILKDAGSAAKFSQPLGVMAEQVFVDAPRKHEQTGCWHAAPTEHEEAQSQADGEFHAVPAEHHDSGVL